jgi:hypothetical protein
VCTELRSAEFQSKEDRHQRSSLLFGTFRLEKPGSSCLHTISFLISNVQLDELGFAEFGVQNPWRGLPRTLGDDKPVRFVK